MGHAKMGRIATTTRNRMNECKKKPFHFFSKGQSPPPHICSTCESFCFPFLNSFFSTRSHLADPSRPIMAVSPWQQQELALGDDASKVNAEGTFPKAVWTTPAGPPKKQAESWAEMWRAWPKTTLFIVSNEFCERFTYYGMRTVLTLYLLNVLKLDGKGSTMVYGAFTMLCYYTPILGSILADGYIGKFKTIFLLSILYTIGQCVLALASAQPAASGFHPWLDFLGLAIIGLGSGGIKPCVCAFGGDQFEPHQQKMLSLFFSAFYFSINAGAMISTFISPMFRASPCLGQDSCYPMAFGIPAALMVLATVLFLSASFWYKKPPPKENIFGEVYNVGKKALRNKWRGKQKEGQYSHWLDHYFDTHACVYDARCGHLRRKTKDPNACHKHQFVADVKSLLRLLVMYSPAPMFWALYDQQGSRWMIQSVMMDCRLWGDTLLLPDQMQTLNAVLILLFIPIFQVIIYPLVSLCVKITPLRKMVVGGLLAALAFVLSAAVQFQVNTTLPDIPSSGHAFMSSMNAFTNCSIDVCAVGADTSKCHTLHPNQTLTNIDQKQRQMFEVEAGWRYWEIRGGDCGGLNKTERVGHSIGEGTTNWMLVDPRGVLFGKADTEKPTEGMGEFSVGFTLALAEEYRGNLALCRKQHAPPDEHPCDPHRAEDFYAWQTEDGDLKASEVFQLPEAKRPSSSSVYSFKSVRPGRWMLYLMRECPKRVGHQTMAKEQLHLNETGIELEIRTQGGVYIVALTGQIPKAEKRVFQVVADNSVSILWQVPQIVVITAGEILFSITGYEFAYSQAASSMKSLVQALWLLTSALGDTIILLIALLSFPNLAVEFLFDAVAMIACMFGLALLAIFYYDYNYYTGGEPSGDSESEGSSHGGSARRHKEEEENGIPSGKKPLAPRRVQIYGTTEEEGTQRN